MLNADKQDGPDLKSRLFVPFTGAGNAEFMNCAL